MPFAAGQILTASALNAAVRKLVAYAERTTDVGGITTTETGILRIDDVLLTAGRRYMVGSSIRAYSTVTTDAHSVRHRYTTNGATPTTSSSGLAPGWEMRSHWSSATRGSYVPAGAGELLSVLLTLQRNAGTGTYAANGDGRIELWIADLGEDTGDIGVDI